MSIENIQKTFSNMERRIFDLECDVEDLEAQACGYEQTISVLEEEIAMLELSGVQEAANYCLLDDISTFEPYYIADTYRFEIASINVEDYIISLEDTLRDVFAIAGKAG